MAHAYTTKRGKNKLSKLGVRKDQQQNLERSLKSVDTSSLKYDGPKESVSTRIAGHIGYSSSATPAGAPIELLCDAVDDTKVELTCCSNSNCTNNCSTSKLLDCSSCLSAKYCGRECQLAHWSEHKSFCKLQKLLRANQEAKQ